eukprot:jgi/Ulvmu1/1994/UM012_0156.1
MPILEDAVFFSVAVGFTMPWVALSSELGHLKMLHGPNFLLYLNLAYFAPSLPTLLLQLTFDQGYNKYFGTAVATLIRQGCAQMVCAVCCVALPLLDWTDRNSLLSLSAVIGAAGSLAFGSCSQLVARFPAKSGQALALGIVAAGPLVLILQLLLQLGANPSHAQQVTFFLLAALAPVTALVAIAWLLLQHWHELQLDKEERGTVREDTIDIWEGSSVDTVLIDAGDAEASLSESADAFPPLQPLESDGTPAAREPPAASVPRWPSLIRYIDEQRLLLPEFSQENWDGFSVHSMPAVAQPLLLVAPSTVHGHSTIRPQLPTCTFWQVFCAVAPLALSLGSSVGVSVLLFPLFTVVRSSGLLGSMLPQALFVARMLPDILGRIVARRYMPSFSFVKVLSIVKFASLLPALAYLWFPREALSDAAAVTFVIGHWLLSGLISAWTYMLLPQAVPEPAAAAHAGNIMSASFQISTIVGLGAVTLLEYFCHPPVVGPGGPRDFP